MLWGAPQGLETGLKTGTESHDSRPGAAEGRRGAAKLVFKAAGKLANVNQKLCTDRAGQQQHHGPLLVAVWKASAHDMTTTRPSDNLTTVNALCAQSMATANSYRCSRF
jgi:hypothetical protein